MAQLGASSRVDASLIALRRGLIPLDDLHDAQRAAGAAHDSFCRRALVADDSPWQIPRYARDMLWVQQGEQAVQVQGERGVFTLPAPADPRESIRWCGRAGWPPLAMWSFPKRARRWSSVGR